MALGRTDGADATVDQASPWDAVTQEGMAFGASLTLDDADDLGSDLPQGDGDGLSDGADDLGSPSAPQPSTTGDGSPATSPEPAGADPSPAPASPDTDPLAGAPAFSFSVGEETRTIDGTYLVPGEGLYVPEDKVPQFQLIASQAATLERQNRELYDRSQQWERLTKWDVTDAQGNTQSLSGRQAIEHMRVANSRLVAHDQILTSILDGTIDPATVFGQSEDGKLFWRQDWVDAIKERMADREQQYEWRTLKHLDSLSAPPPPPPPAEPSVETYAMPTIDALIREHKVEGLTAADKQYLKGQFELYVRSTPTGKVVDPRFLTAMQDRAALRAEHAKVATAGKTADAFNGGMQRGRQTAPPRAPAPAPTPLPTGRNAPKQRTEPSANELWSSLIAEAQQGV